jgi:hypothetical protein
MNLAPKALFYALLETKEDKDDHQIILDVIGPVWKHINRRCREALCNLGSPDAPKTEEEIRIVYNAFQDFNLATRLRTHPAVLAANGVLTKWTRQVA